MAPRDVDVKLLEQYLADHARAQTSNRDDRLALHKMLNWLVKTGVVQVPRSPPLARSQSETIGDHFEQAMLHQRGLSVKTLKVYLPYVLQFLEERFGDAPVKLDTLVAEDVTGFVQRSCH